MSAGVDLLGGKRPNGGPCDTKNADDCSLVDEGDNELAPKTYLPGKSQNILGHIRRAQHIRRFNDDLFTHRASHWRPPHGQRRVADPHPIKPPERVHGWGSSRERRGNVQHVAVDPEHHTPDTPT